MARAGRDVGFLADDRVDARGLCLEIQIDRAIEDAMVRQRDCWHARLDGVADHLGDPARAVEQAVFGMRMKVDEAHALRSSLTTASMWKVWGNMSTKATSTRV